PRRVRVRRGIPPELHDPLLRRGAGAAPRTLRALARAQEREGADPPEAALPRVDPGDAVADPRRRRLQGGGLEERPARAPAGPGDAARRRRREGDARREGRPEGGPEGGEGEEAALSEKRQP